MKKINPSAVTGGMPINTDDFRTVFNSEIWGPMEAMLSPFNSDTQGIIVSGCTLTPNGPNWDISAGIVYLNGEFMRLAAATNQALPKYIAPAAAVNDNRVFSDQTTKTAFITKSAELVGAAPGAGQYVAITSSTDPDDRRWVNVLVNKQIATVFQSTIEVLGGIRTQNSGPYYLTKEIDVVDWNMDTDASKAVNHGLSDTTKIRRIDGVIFDDSGVPYPLYQFSTSVNAGVNNITSTVINLARLTGGTFDSTSFDSTGGFVRAKLTIEYIP